MYSAAGDTTSLVPGFPIRTSSDQRSVDSSPRPIAASHVLHRLLMPRHPPCALDNLTNTPTPVTQSSSKPKNHTQPPATPESTAKKDHAWLRSRKKMLASTLHLTTTPADHHPHTPTTAREAVMTAQRNTIIPHTPSRRG